VKTASALIFIGLAGCAELALDFKWVESEEELRAECGDSMIAHPLGCALTHGRECTIVAYRPRHFDDKRRLETLGHELLHCVNRNRIHL
jgi:hypothetical protein